MLNSELNFNISTEPLLSFKNEIGRGSRSKPYGLSWNSTFVRSLFEFLELNDYDPFPFPGD
jgi:hypothetical protein